MKKLFLLLCLLLPLFVLSQNADPIKAEIGFLKDEIRSLHKSFENSNKTPIIYYWNQYVVDCNQLVPDTIVVQGVIHTQYKATMVFGKMQYILIPKDTVWDKYTKSKYKEGDNHFYISGSITPIYYSTNNSNWITNRDNSLYNGVYTNKSTPAPNIQINKKVIYQIPKQRATWSDFWERWLVEQKIIKMN